MKTQKQIISQIVKTSKTVSKLENSLYKMEYSGKSTEATEKRIKEVYKKMHSYCSLVTEQGFNDNPVLEETLCCDWEEFKDAYIK